MSQSRQPPPTDGRGASRGKPLRAARAHPIVLANILEAMSDGLIVIDAAGEIVLVNQALCSILERKEDEVLGRSWSELFLSDPENLEFSSTVVEVIQRRQVLNNREVGYRTPAGNQKSLIATTSLLTEGAQAVGVVAVFKDVTELEGLHRRQRQLLERSRRLYEERQESLDRVARAVAHEVRNPVTAIGGLASRLRREFKDGTPPCQYLDRILAGTQRLEQVVTQVQAYAYLPRPVRVKRALAPWLASVIAAHQLRAEAQGVALTLMADHLEDLEAVFDPELLAQALGHLLDNSLDAMPQGGELSLALGQRESQAVIKVRDTGEGINQSDLPYLFDPFFSTKADRVGMSLAITQRIIAEHDGQISVVSRNRQGTIFTISLPLRPPSHFIPHSGPPRPASLK